MNNPTLCVLSDTVQIVMNICRHSNSILTVIKADWGMSYFTHVIGEL